MVSAAPAKTKKSTATASVKTAQDSLAELRIQLNALYLDRSQVIDVCIAAILGRKNGVLLGSPGTGKTGLIKDLVKSLDLSSFYYLMSATTQPDEILGSIDLNALQNRSEFRLNLEGKLADVQIGIMDEVFKANSPCLNALLELGLDKTITNGTEVVQAPLMTLFGMSNELPQHEDLAAFWDRFAIRCWVNEIDLPTTRTLMLREAGLIAVPQISVKLSGTQLKEIQDSVSRVVVPEDIVDTAISIVRRLTEHAVKPSARKMVQIINILRSYATVQGATEVSEDHLEVLQFVLWDEQAQIPHIKEVIKEFINASVIKYDNLVGEVRDACVRIEAMERESDGSTFLGAGIRGINNSSARMLVDLKENLKQASGPRKAKIQSAIRQITEMRETIILPKLAEIQ